MPVMRVEKNGNYTVMANYHLRDNRLSLKAKGLLSVMLSLPAGWDYTLAGLAHISREGISAIRGAVLELECAGYVVRTRIRNKAGQLTDSEYTIYEFPQGENLPDPGMIHDSAVPVMSSDRSQGMESGRSSSGNPVSGNPMSGFPTLGIPPLDDPALGNRTQTNTDIERKEKRNTDRSNPNQSGTYPSIGDMEPQEPGMQHQQAAISDAAAKMDTACSQAQLLPSSSHEAMSVQQEYMTEETSIPGMRRRLTYDEFVRKVKRQIDYWDLIDGKYKDEIENILSIMVEVLSAQCQTFTISGRKYPADLVHYRFSEINANTVEYVLECMHNCGSDIRNIKQYLITALFNAPATCDSYYGAAVRRDFAFLRG